jgi:hypothetical protein
MVDAFPDVKIQMVTAFPDLKIKYVTAFPGLPWRAQSGGRPCGRL